MVDCPAEDCEYTGVRTSVLGHYSGKQDDAHAGGYAEAKRLIGDENDAGATSTDTDSSGDDVSTSDNNSSGGNPTMGQASPDSNDGGGSSEQELPCGHESFDESEAPQPPFEVSCSECGQSWVVEQ